MTEHRHFRYEKPPLIEAVFEMFVEPGVLAESGRGAQQALELKYRGQFSGRHHEFIEHQLQLNVHENTIMAEKQEPSVRHQLWQENDDKLIQFGPNMASINYLSGAYKSYEHHAEEVACFLKDYREHFEPKRILYLGQRFINQISIVDGKSPAEYFRVYPILPSEIEGRHRPFAIQIQTEPLEPNGNVTLSLVYRGLNESGHVYVLDLYARSSDNSIQIREWNDTAHAALRRAFRLALTDAGISCFGEQNDDAHT